MDLFVGVLTFSDDIFCLGDLVHPTLLNLVVEVCYDFRVFEVFRVGINWVDGRITFLVGAVLRQAIEAAGGFLGDGQIRI